MKKIRLLAAFALFFFIFIFQLSGKDTKLNNCCSTSEVPLSAELVRPLLPGARVPSLTLSTFDKKDFETTVELAKKPTILIFYRGGWCPFCNLHFGQLQKVESDLKALGFQIVAISPDIPEGLNKTAVKEKLGYTLLSDSSMSLAKAFGIAFKVDDPTIEKYKGYGINLESASGQNHHLLPVPSVFIIGQDLRVDFSYVNPDYKIRLSPEVLLAAAQAYIKRTEKK